MAKLHILGYALFVTVNVFLAQRATVVSAASPLPEKRGSSSKSSPCGPAPLRGSPAISNPAQSLSGHRRAEQAAQSSFPRRTKKHSPLLSDGSAPLSLKLQGEGEGLGRGSPLSVVHGSPSSVFHGSPSSVFHGSPLSVVHGSPAPLKGPSPRSVAGPPSPLSLGESGGPILVKKHSQPSPQGREGAGESPRGIASDEPLPLRAASAPQLSIPPVKPPREGVIVARRRAATTHVPSSQAPVGSAPPKAPAKEQSASQRDALVLDFGYGEPDTLIETSEAHRDAIIKKHAALVWGSSQEREAVVAKMLAAREINGPIPEREIKDFYRRKLEHAIFVKLNPAPTIQKVIDLHGQSCEQAIYLVEALLRHDGYESPEKQYQGVFRFNVGLGHNSTPVSGRSKHPLRLAVRKCLKNMLVYYYDSSDGTVTAAKPNSQEAVAHRKKAMGDHAPIKPRPAPPAKRMIIDCVKGLKDALDQLCPEADQYILQACMRQGMDYPTAYKITVSTSARRAAAGPVSMLENFRLDRPPEQVRSDNIKEMQAELTGFCPPDLVLESYYIEDDVLRAKLVSLYTKQALNRIVPKKGTISDEHYIANCSNFFISLHQMLLQREMKKKASAGSPASSGSSPRSQGKDSPASSNPSEAIRGKQRALKKKGPVAAASVDEVALGGMEGPACGASPGSSPDQPLPRVSAKGGPARVRGKQRTLEKERPSAAVSMDEVALDGVGESGPGASAALSLGQPLLRAAAKEDTPAKK